MSLVPGSAGRLHEQPCEVMYDLAADSQMTYAPFARKKATSTHNTSATRPLTKGARSLILFYFKAVLSCSDQYSSALILLETP